MKVRTCVMVVCMTVVPALAMFSHHLPARVREALRARIWEPVEDWVASLTKREPAKVGRSPTIAEPAEPDREVLAEPSPVPSAVPERDLAVAAWQSSPSAGALASLGATAIDCRPFDGLAGTHVASCRVAVDAAGQLHRVFQAAGGSPDEAFASLVDTVRAWKERVAGAAATPRH